MKSRRPYGRSEIGLRTRAPARCALPPGVGVRDHDLDVRLRLRARSGAGALFEEEPADIPGELDERAVGVEQLEAERAVEAGRAAEISDDDLDGDLLARLHAASQRSSSRPASTAATRPATTPARVAKDAVSTYSSGVWSCPPTGPSPSSVGMPDHAVQEPSETPPVPVSPNVCLSDLPSSIAAPASVATADVRSSGEGRPGPPRSARFPGDCRRRAPARRPSRGRRRSARGDRRSGTLCWAPCSRPPA